MRSRLLFLALFCGPLCLAFGHLESARGQGKPMMSEEQAISTLRTGTTNREVEFIMARKFQPAPGDERIAQKALDEARSRHVGVFADGLFVSLMRAGGFVFLEYDARSERATKVYLIAADEYGRPILHSWDASGDIIKGDALLLIRKSEDFSKAFFNSGDASVDSLLSEFGGKDVAALDVASLYGYFEIPNSVAKVAKQRDQLLRLIGLDATVNLWPERRALAMPIYAASPETALKGARDQMLALAKEFLTRQGKDLDSIDELTDPHSIRTSPELAERLQWLADFTSFLNERSPLALDSALYQANVRISSIPLTLTVEVKPARWYQVLTLPDLISIWTPGERGGVALIGVSEGE
jgi:hypothetical protein